MKTSRWFLSVATVALVAPAAFAQENAPAQPVDNEVIYDTVIVTSQKRQQNVLDVPLAVDAITADRLETLGATSIDDLGEVTAGLNIANFEPGSSTLSSRGIYTITGSNFATSPVGIYIDETPIPTSGGLISDISLFDIERVEYLRGPQGTLFGEGSMAGTIRVITQAPDPEAFSGRLSVNVATTAESDEISRSANGSLNIPLASNAALRVGANYRYDGGWVDNVGSGEDDSNDFESLTLRGQLRVDLTEALSVDASLVYQDQETGDVSFQTSPGVWQPSSQVPGVSDPNRAAPHVADYTLGNITVQYDLGMATFVSATSYFDESSDFTDNIDFALQLLFSPGTQGETDALGRGSEESLTQEFRLVSYGDNTFDWTLGALYKDADIQNQTGFDIRMSSFVPELGFLGPPYGGALNDQVLSQATASKTEYAIFAEGEYEFNEHWRMTVGLRQYWADWTGGTEELASSALFGTVAGTNVTNSGDDSALSPNFILTYEPNEETILYVRASKGFRSGGVNFDAATRSDLPATFGAETLWSYEGGIKQTWDRVQLNLYGYCNDWEDLQLSFATADNLFVYNDNAGGARSFGGELELTAALSDQLTLNTALGYVDAEISDDVIGPNGTTVVVGGNEIPLTPEWIVNANLDYRFQVSETLSGMANLSYAYKSKTFSDAENTPAERNDVFNQVNARIGVEGERYGAYLFARNLLDEEDTTLINNLFAGTPLIAYSYVRPRTVGVELKARF